MSRVYMPVLPKHTLFKVLHFILAKCRYYTLFILFSVKFFKILYHRMELSKSTLFILYFLKCLIHVSSLSPNERSALASITHIFFKPFHFKFDFPCKNWYFGRLFICKSYFINTLFRGKSYFIWRKIILYLEI